MALQRAHATSISKRAAREGSSKLGALWGLIPCSLVDMLHVTGEDFETW
jgi:sulfite exporter TauE/SafE